SIVAMSAIAVDTRARSMNAAYWPCAMVARMATTATVISSSSSVKPTPERMAAVRPPRRLLDGRRRRSRRVAGLPRISLWSVVVGEPGTACLPPCFHRPRARKHEPSGLAARSRHAGPRPRRQAPPGTARAPGWQLARLRPQALADDGGEQDAAVGDDEHPVVEHHAVDDEADRSQALADEQPARDARAAVGHLLADLADQGGEQDRRGRPADPVRVHAPPPAPPRARSGKCACACVAAAAAWPTATAIWFSPPTMSPMAYSPGVRVCWCASTSISPPGVRAMARSSTGTEVVKPRNE